MRQPSLRRAARVVGLAAEAPAAELRHQCEHAGAVGLLVGVDEHVDPRLRRVEIEREEQPLDPGPEPDRGGRRAAYLLDDVVVAAAAADRALGSDRLVHELEGRARVVVEPAHERRLELVADAVRVEVAAHGVEVLAARVAQRLADLGRVGERRLHVRVLHVEDTQRRRRSLLARLGVQLVLVLVEPGVQALEVGGAALAVADRVELEAVAGRAEPAQELVVELDDLGVERGIVGADRLDRELPVLAVAAALRAPVAVHRRDREELHRLRLSMQAVLDVGAADRGGALRPQRERAASPVLERVHLLLDDVRAGPRRAGEEVRVLEPGRLDAAVAVERAEPLHLRRNPLPLRLFGGEDVVGSARGLEAAHARSSTRNGLRESSAPSVVGPPWPG